MLYVSMGKKRKKVYFRDERRKKPHQGARIYESPYFRPPKSTFS
jgi:hypothetical protein